MSKPLGERLRQGVKKVVECITAEPKSDRIKLRDGTFLEVTVMPPIFYGQQPRFVTRIYSMEDGGEPLSIKLEDVPSFPTI